MNSYSFFFSGLQLASPAAEEGVHGGVQAQPAAAPAVHGMVVVGRSLMDPAGLAWGNRGSRDAGTQVGAAIGSSCASRPLTC